MIRNFLPNFPLVHKSCYQRYLNEYRNKKSDPINREIFQQRENENFITAVCFNQIVTRVHESASLSDKEGGAHLLAYELGSKYANLLHEKCINYTPHGTRFTNELLEAIHKFEKGL